MNWRPSAAVLMVPSHSVLSTYLNNATPVFWRGTLAVEEDWVF